VTGVEDGATYILGSVPTAGCDTTDALAGVATLASLTVNGGNSNGVGSFTAICDGASDNAGNTASASLSYSVIYDFGGFTDPIDPQAVNQVKGGQTVSVKFGLNGDRAWPSSPQAIRPRRKWSVTVARQSTRLKRPTPPATAA
jgi:hypothetical protein